jgi:hypothetical protein
MQEQMEVCYAIKPCPKCCLFIPFSYFTTVCLFPFMSFYVFLCLFMCFYVFLCLLGAAGAAEGTAAGVCGATGDGAGGAQGDTV